MNKQSLLTRSKTIDLSGIDIGTYKYQIGESFTINSDSIISVNSILNIDDLQPAHSRLVIKSSADVVYGDYELTESNQYKSLLLPSHSQLLFELVVDLTETRAYPPITIDITLYTNF